MKKRLISICTILLILFGASAGLAETKLSLMLDWFPNVDHLPVYVAKANGYLADENIKITIISPSETSDALKLAATGKVDLAISYQPQAIIAAARGLKFQVVGRLVEHPLTTLLYLQKSGITKPADLNGKRIGYTVPGLMDILLKAFAGLNGIEKYQAVNVGFTIVAALTAGKVDAVMGPFKTYETVTMEHKGLKSAYFELEKHGIPDYDELIFIAGKNSAAKNQKAIQGFARAVQRGIDFARKDPYAALKLYLKQVPEADAKIEKDAFRLTLPYFAHQQKLKKARWQKFADFAFKHGLIEKAVEVSTILNVKKHPI